MTAKGMSVFGLVAVFAISYAGWKLAARGAYESAEYTVADSNGSFEIREYPELVTVVTDMHSGAKGDDGSFVRLFRYISGRNDRGLKVAMTTPVLMEPASGDSWGQMAFVLPKEISKGAIPKPMEKSVRIRKRPAGSFAVYRFQGRIHEETLELAKGRLHDWVRERGLKGTGSIEVAGYDPPWTPGPLRRNEVLVRLRDASGTATPSPAE